jgi:hypothetical protein
MNYVLAEFLVDENSYVFRFDDGRYTYIDLLNDYPNYKWCKKSLCDEYWHVTIIKNNSKIPKIIGSIEEFEYLKLRKINTNIKKFWSDDILYRMSKQTEYDKYLFNKKTNCDNAKLFNLLNSMYEEEEKETINNKIKITYV